MSQDPTTPSSRSSEELQAAVVAEARSYIGVRWRHRGRNRNAIDCVGLILAAFGPFGLHDWPDDYSYSRQSTNRELIEIFRRHSREVPLGPGGLEALEDADILILKDTAYPQHVGLLATNWGVRTLIHASVAHGAVLEERITDDIRRKAITAFRMRSL